MRAFLEETVVIMDAGSGILVQALLLGTALAGSAGVYLAMARHMARDSSALPFRLDQRFIAALAAFCVAIPIIWYSYLRGSENFHRIILQGENLLLEYEMPRRVAQYEAKGCKVRIEPGMLLGRGYRRVVVEFATWEIFTGRLLDPAEAEKCLERLRGIAIIE